MQDVLARALQEHQRSLLFAQANVAYAALRENLWAWAQELDERRAWDATIMDGLENGPYEDERLSD